MKQRLLVMLATLLLLSGAVWAQGPVGPQSLPGGGWITGTQVQNVGTTSTDITMTVYGQSTGEWSLTEYDVASGASVNFLATGFGWADGSIGSAIVYAGQFIVAQTTETNGTAAAQYQGIDQPDIQVNFPLVKNDYKGSGKYTTFYVQNAGSIPAVIYATYTAEDGTKYLWNSSSTVDVGRMVVLNPTDVSFPGDQLGSLVVTSTVPIAGVVNEHDVSDTIILQATRGFAPGDAGTTLLIPTIKRQFGNRSTGPIIQNVSGGLVNITITYQGTGISFVQYANNVPDGASVTFYENAEICPSGATCGHTGTPLPVGTLASAIVTANGDIVGVVNETFFTIPSGQRQRQTVTSAFNQADATTKIAVPLYKVNHDYKNTGVQLQNTDLSNTAHFTATFSLGSGASVTNYILTGPINPGQYATLFKLYSSLPSGCSWVGSGFPSTWSTSGTGVERFGSITIVADQSVVAAVTEADDDPTLGNRQDIKSYEGFNLTP